MTKNQPTLSDLERFRFVNFPSIGFKSADKHGSAFGWEFIDGLVFFFNRGFLTLPVGVKFVGIFTLVMGSENIAKKNVFRVTCLHMHIQHDEF